MHLVLLLDSVAPGERIGYAMSNMVFKYLSLNLMQGCPDRIDLRQEVDAIAVLLNHPAQTADLALDTLEPCCHGLAGCLVHAHHYTPVGY